MSRWVLRVQPQAERDLIDIGTRLEASAGRGVARNWMLAFEKALLNLAENLRLGAASDLLGEGRRRFVLRPYLIVYRIELPDLVRIIRIVDGRRDLPALFASIED